MSWFSKAVSGGGGGAIGGIIGSVVPGIGTAIGAAIGGTAGAISGNGQSKVNAVQKPDGSTQQFMKSVKNLSETSKKNLQLQSQEIKEEKKQTRLIMFGLIGIGIVVGGVLIFKLARNR